MNVLEYFNTAIGSCFIIILLAIDYLRKYNTDNFQRKLLIIMLSAIFVSAVFDFIGLTLERCIDIDPYNDITSTLYYVWSVYLIARNCCYYFVAVFIDYFAHGNMIRTKKFLKIVCIFLVLYSISVIPNIQHGYYFYISRDNTYMPGTFYLLQVFISYFPIILILLDVSLAPKYIKRPQILLTISFVFITAIGAAIDIVLRTTNLIWPCVTAAVLYMYFFIIRADAKIDSLTGIGNRNNFYEYINILSGQLEKKEYAFIKIDLNSLEEINNYYGYLEGNNALRDMSTIIKSCIRHTDFAARYGGDEFILITLAENNIQRIIDRILETIEIQNKKHTKPYELSISYGFDTYTTNSGWEVQDFLARLDNKIQKSKANI